MSDYDELIRLQSKALAVLDQAMTGTDNPEMIIQLKAVQALEPILKRSGISIAPDKRDAASSFQQAFLARKKALESGASAERLPDVFAEIDSMEAESLANQSRTH